jgi:hypothetical protein
MTNIETAGLDQPNTMVANGDADRPFFSGVSYFYPDGPGDARLFRDYHGARPLHPDRWPWPDWEETRTTVVGDARITYPVATTVTCELVKDDDA